MKYLELNNGVKMPQEGFGVFQITDLTQCRDAVIEALETGYRLFDTAAAYNNEAAVGEAIRLSGVKRENLFITTKIGMDSIGEQKTKDAFERQMKLLGLDYLDLYLVHMPWGDYYGAWRTLEALYKEGRIRAIGVSNFSPERLMDLKYNFDIIPAVNQIELHPLYQREDELKFMRDLGIQPQAWAPFAEGFGGMFTNPVLNVIAQKHGKTVGQVILRWNIQRGVAIIPKTVRKERMKENISIWDFELDSDDMKAIATLDLGHPQMLRTNDPSEVQRVYEFSKNPRIR
ncbi:aldo/keto reductase [Heminiphilus faecis]|uniref:Aldo/keto reductase n=1 Tax=Heminiphilus faecis TaxID=2601703 RepID=A0ABV4D072_9BACT